MNITIVGAGQSGRGFLGRLAYLSQAQIVFIDQDKALVDALNEQGMYQISFFGGKRAPLCVQGYVALYDDDDDAVTAIANADLILTCVLAENLSKILPLLKRAFSMREELPPVLVCENGVDPAMPLRNALSDDVKISEAVLLCTTCARGTDIVSQDLDFLPYDLTRLDAPIPIMGFFPEMRFDVLCRRKIYTYNCLSACICYLGAEKGYESFAAAAVDPEIYEELLGLQAVLDRVIAREYSIPVAEQAAFSQAALDKFTNPELDDSIARNARDAHRKLGRTERIIAPMLLAKAQGENITIFERMIASAMDYGRREGTINIDPTNIQALNDF